MDKKALRLSVVTLVEIILFAAITLLIALPACSRIFGLWTGEPESGTVKSLDAIKLEVNNLEDEKEISIYIDKEHIIKIFNVNSNERPEFEGCSKEPDKSCICVCTAPSCNLEEKEVNRCEAFDGDYFSKPRLIRPSFAEGEAKVQTCSLIKKQGKVTIKCDSDVV